MQPDLHLSVRPAPPLDRFIEQLWYWNGTPPAHARDHLMPSGTASLILNLAEDEIRSYEGADDSTIVRHRGAVLVGVCSRYTVIDTREQRHVMGVVFRPGGLTPFFAPAAEELHNSHTNLRDLWSSPGETLRERVLAQPTAFGRLKVVESELRHRILRPLDRRAEVDYLIRQLSREPGQSIGSLSERSGLGARRLTRLFSLETGLTPKVFARVKRFERFLDLLHPQPDWADLALRCGYFDQSHLIRDCRELSGFTPAQLQARRNGNTNHVVVE